ncbi:CD209 antigen-like protein 2 isoform X2 [Silurus meridionalis]|nr:CD209 antigen-like protein 2 isoform X2 [Silurus meridionalis]
MQEPTSKEMTAEPNSSGCRCYRLAVVCLMMLVVLLLAAIAILWFKLTSCKSFAEERDQLQRKSDELQQKFSQLKKDIDTPKWLYFNSSIYYISNETKSWSESRKDCQDRGADLVIINSSDEQDLVGMWRSGKEVWIGANDIEAEKVWKWVDGTVISSGFWQKGEPNNARNREDCAVSGYRTERENWSHSHPEFPGYPALVPPPINDLMTDASI